MLINLIFSSKYNCNKKTVKMSIPRLMHQFSSTDILSNSFKI